jgi:hypothetical protein
MAGMYFNISVVQGRWHYLDLNELTALIGWLHIWSGRNPKNLEATETCVL